MAGTAWREVDHPRDPHTGEFTEKPGGWVNQALFQLNLGPEADLLNMVRYGQVTDREELAGGNSAETVLVHYSRLDASTGMAVRKRSNVSDSQMEVWASQIGRAIGAPVPVAVHDPDDDRVVHLEYIHGLSVHELIEDQEFEDEHEEPEQKYLDAWVDTPDGVMLGVLDMLIGNRDRHIGNWLVRDDDSGIVGIDHTGTWADVQHDIRGLTAEQEEEQGYPWMPWDSSPFVENLTNIGGLPPWVDQKVIEQAGQNLRRLVERGAFPERMGKRLLARWENIVRGEI